MPGWTHCIRRAAWAGLTASLLPAAAWAQAADADAPGSRPRWEAGVLAGAGWVTDYPGADQSHGRGLLAPLIIYRGPVLRIDQDGVRGRLLQEHDWEFDVSSNAAFNARANEARSGMPPLDYLFGFGPQLIYKGARHLPGSPTLHLKATAMASTDFHHIHGRGVALDPELRWRVQSPGGMSATTLNFGLQPTWASRALNQYFYEVEPAYATATRPAYSARAGYLGTELKLSVSHRVSGQLSWFVAARGMSLQGSANADSPLLRRNTGFSVGFGVLWTPWHSEARADDAAAHD